MTVTVNDAIEWADGYGPDARRVDAQVCYVLAAEVRRLREQLEWQGACTRALTEWQDEQVAKVKRAVADLLLFESNLEALTSANASGRRIAYRAAAEYVAALFGADVETAPKRPSVAPIDGGEEPQP